MVAHRCQSKKSIKITRTKNKIKSKMKDNIIQKKPHKIIIVHECQI